MYKRRERFWFQNLRHWFVNYLILLVDFFPDKEDDIYLYSLDICHNVSQYLHIFHPQYMQTHHQNKLIVQEESLSANRFLQNIFTKNVKNDISILKIKFQILKYLLISQMLMRKKIKREHDIVGDKFVKTIKILFCSKENSFQNELFRFKKVLSFEFRLLFLG